MNSLILVGIVSLCAGLLMIMFRGIGGRLFCKMGKAVFWVFSTIKPIKEMVDMVYDESKAPSRFLILGVVFILQGLFSISLYYLIDA